MNDIVGVVDVGSSSTKIGYSGDDMPFGIFPSTLTKLAKYQPCVESSPEANISNHSDYPSSNNANSASHPIIRGVVKDWEKISKLWENITSEFGSDTVDSTSILLAESPMATKKDRCKWAELLFESHHAPSICFMNSASTSIFASGRTSGLSIDCGAGVTSTVPVYEGLQLRHASITSPYGGQDVTYYLQQLLNQNHVNLSFSDVRLIKEARAVVSTSMAEDTPRSTESNHTSVILPDGTEVEVDESIFTVCANDIFHNDLPQYKGLIHQTYESISLCDESLRKLLYNNMILSGGTTQIPGFGDRLRLELQDKVSQETLSKSDVNPCDIYVIPNSINREAGYTSQSKYAAWIGGSIVGSMDTYKDIKISRQEWEESADSIIETKSY